jgi:hypothetical protein
MNPLIENLAAQCYGDGTDGFYGFDKTKFAILIMEECAQAVADPYCGREEKAELLIKDWFGVEE